MFFLVFHILKEPNLKTKTHTFPRFHNMRSCLIYLPGVYRLGCWDAYIGGFFCANQALRKPTENLPLKKKQHPLPAEENDLRKNAF